MANEVMAKVEDRVGYVILNRPDARNAVYPEMLDPVIAAIEAHTADPEVRVIVLTGAGQAFCAGADRVKFLQPLPHKSVAEIQDDIYRRFMGVARALKLCPKPTIAAVRGAAVGAGCEFAVACDFRIAAPDALFWENWIDLGIIPPLGGMFMLPRLIGYERAADMILRARKVDAQLALAWGLVSDVVEGPFDPAVHKFALSLARRSPRALALAKQGLRRGADSSLAAEWEFNIQAQSHLLTGPDFAEAMAAMAEARHPQF